MPKQVDVYYDGWGDHWRWGSLMSSTAVTGRPLIAFEYSDEALDRLFKRRGLNPARIGPLDRLTYIGSHAMGAMSFEPVASEISTPIEDISLAELAEEILHVLSGEGGAFLQNLLLIGGSPHGARPKALLYSDLRRGGFTTIAAPGSDAWLVKFPAHQEHPEVCAIGQWPNP